MSDSHRHMQRARITVWVEDDQPQHWTADCSCGEHAYGHGDLPLFYLSHWVIGGIGTALELVRQAMKSSGELDHNE